ncbi:hypothetical protein CAPTEDRAFT_226274 [Capitella teleta]|uniref:Protein zwilch n=1 Tax=Capitella teleta TaxID=283909 RepID=R7TNJ8_CAPTE|nr:hypothetical protein CAPTEDRAFT_226274 [Capitella teleta]|eukprot:ELT95433.1 hypothetical protein CAPTEDRAFT_226274 [Capitella teleta]
MDSKVLNGVFGSLKRSISESSRDAALDKALQTCIVELVTDCHPLANVIHCSQQNLPVILIKSNEEVSPDLHSPLHQQDMSVDGSPLKLRTFGSNSSDATDGDFPQESSSLHGVPVRLARRFLGKYNMLCGGKLKLPPLWVLCDAHQDEVALSSQMVSHDGRVMTLLNGITVKGPVDRSKFNQLQNVCPSMNGKVECCALYDVLGNVSAGNATLQKLEISVHWDKVSALGQVPASYARTNLNVRPSVGDARSAALSLYQELKSLKVFVSGLVEGKVSWPGSKRSENSVCSLKSLCQDIEKDSKPTVNEKKIPSNSSPLALLLIEQRKDLDFTEHVWNILKGSTSYKELKSGFHFVLSRLQTNTLIPMVHSTAKSSLSQMVRDSYHQQMVVPDLEGSAPLRLLIEIGLEKLARDYGSILIGKEFCCASHFKKFTSYEGDHQSSFRKRLTQLEKLHQCLEVANSLDASHVFSFLIKTSEVAHYFESHPMLKWRMDCTCDDSTVSSCLLTPHNPLPHLSANPYPGADEIDSYFMTTINPCML